MTLNVEFLFDGESPDGSANFEWKNAPDEAAEHIEEIAEVIKSINADIINLVEVENIEVLQSMINEHLQGYGYKAYLVNGKDTYTGQDVGMLTRIDPENNDIFRWDTKGQSGSVQKSVSKNYYTTIKINEKDVTFIGLHFLAFPTRSDRIHKRQAQANAIMKLAKEKSEEGDEIVIWGDFNDYDGDCLDVQSKMPVTTVLSDIKEIDQSKSEDDLENVACVGNVPQTVRYTSWWDKDRDGYYEYPDEFTSIDHILISKGFAEFITSVEFPHEYNPAEVSDHFPITVDFEFDDSGTGSDNLYISALLPNPIGNETRDEIVWITNPSDNEVTIEDWYLRDKAGHIWTFESNTKIGDNKTVDFKRNGEKLSLNNAGDVIELIDKDGKIVHSVSYGKAYEEEVIEFAP